MHTAICLTTAWILVITIGPHAAILSSIEELPKMINGTDGIQRYISGQVHKFNLLA